MPVSEQKNDLVAQPVAVLDIGATSIRMAIGEIDQAGAVRTIETLQQAVDLGKNTFTLGEISKSTIEDCVRVLKSYKQLLSEYQITEPEKIRVVATSAVREARNRLSFQDRIFIATGLEVEVLDEAEVTRITFMGILPYLEAEKRPAEAQSFVVEVGGGSSEVLLVRGSNVVYSHTYRMGSLRLSQALESVHAPTGKRRAIMENQIQQIMSPLAKKVPKDETVEMIAVGGDVRFAAAQILPDWNRDELARVPRSDLEKLTDELLSLNEDEIVERFHVPFQEAETVGKALLVYVELARMFGLEDVQIGDVNLRDGLLKEVALRETWTEAFSNQIVRSAIDLGRRFNFDEAHARHVAELSRKLFDELRDEHQLDKRYQTILYIAALLHEIGLFIGQRGFHKHSMYLINNSELFGLGKRDLLLVSLVARYHRRAAPQPNHEGYGNLAREYRVAVSKLSAILRLAIALNATRSQRIQEFECRRDIDRLTIMAPHVDDLSLEQIALEQNGWLFEQVFGMQVLLRRQR